MTLDPAPMDKTELDELLQTYREAVMVSASDRTAKLLSHILYLTITLSRLWESEAERVQSEMAAKS